MLHLVIPAEAGIYPLTADGFRIKWGMTGEFAGLCLVILVPFLVIPAKAPNPYLDCR